MKKFACTCVLAASLTLTGGVWAQFVEADEKAASIELISEPASYNRGSNDGLTDLEAAARCSRTKMRTSEVQLAWDSRREAVQAHRVDISKFRTGFSRGKFLTTGELRPDADAAQFESTESSVNYYWRLLTKTDDGWVVGGAGRFRTPVCPADMVVEP